MRRLVTMFGTAFLFAVGAIAVIGRLGRDFEARVAVRGHSMEPTLFDGDWLLVDNNAYRTRAPRVGDVVVARDPRSSERVLVKRVIGMAGRELQVGGDHPAHREDANEIGLVAHGDVMGRAWFRYWPLSRFGPVGAVETKP